MISVRASPFPLGSTVLSVRVFFARGEDFFLPSPCVLLIIIIMMMRRERNEVSAAHPGSGNTREGHGGEVRPVSLQVPVLFSFNAVLYTFDSTA